MNISLFGPLESPFIQFLTGMIEGGNDIEDCARSMDVVDCEQQKTYYGKTCR